MRDVRVPFRQAIAPATMEEWLLTTEDGQIELPEEHPSWDPSVDILVARKIVVDGARLRDECALVDDAHVRLVAGWQSDNGRTRCFPWRHDIRLPDRFEGRVELQVPGGDLATSVDLVVGSVLVVPGRGQSAVSAKIPGAWLWKDVRELRLEHSRGRFPMEWTDFKRSGLSEDAPWYLDWPSQEWSAPLLGALRLRLNATNPAMRNILELPEADPQRRLAIMSAILDVAKQLVIAGLGSDEFVEEHASYPEGSVGFSVRLLIALAFPHESVKSVRGLLRDRAGDFHMRLQAAVVPFRGLEG